MRRSSPEEQAAWRHEAYGYCEEFGRPDDYDVEPKPPPEASPDLQPVWDGLAELDPAGLSDAELDVLVRRAGTPAIKAAAAAEIQRRLPSLFDDLPF